MSNFFIGSESLLCKWNCPCDKWHYGLVLRLGSETQTLCPVFLSSVPPACPIHTAHSLAKAKQNPCGCTFACVGLFCLVALQGLSVCVLRNHLRVVPHPPFLSLSAPKSGASGCHLAELCFYWILQFPWGVHPPLIPFPDFFRSVLNTIVCHSTHSAKQNSGRCLVKYVQKQREVHNDTVNRASMIILWNVSMDTLDWIHHKLFFKRVPPLCFRVIILGFGTNKLRSWKYHGAGLC